MAFIERSQPSTPKNTYLGTLMEAARELKCEVKRDLRLSEIIDYVSNDADDDGRGDWEEASNALHLEYSLMTQTGKVLCVIELDDARRIHREPRYDAMLKSMILSSAGIPYMQFEQDDGSWTAETVIQKLFANKAFTARYADGTNSESSSSTNERMNAGSLDGKARLDKKIAALERKHAVNNLGRYLTKGATLEELALMLEVNQKMDIHSLDDYEEQISLHDLQLSATYISRGMRNAIERDRYKLMEARRIARRIRYFDN